jgi:hypothetical protein
MGEAYETRLGCLWPEAYRRQGIVAPVVNRPLHKFAPFVRSLLRSKLRVAQAFDLAGITNTVGLFLRVFCEGRESEMRRQVGLITCPQQNQIAHTASQPILAKRRKDWGTLSGNRARKDR